MNANQRFKRSSGRFWWLGGIAAIGFHAGLLFLTPPINIVGFRGQPIRARMVVTIGAWEAPTCRGGCAAGYARYDTAFSPPEVENWSEVNYRLARVYPLLLWKYREPSQAVVEISIGRFGVVQHTVLLESADNGTDEALLAVAKLLRFTVGPPYDTARGMTGRVEIGVAPPL